MSIVIVREPLTGARSSAGGWGCEVAPPPEVEGRTLPFGGLLVGDVGRVGVAGVEPCGEDVAAVVVPLAAPLPVPVPFNFSSLAPVLGPLPLPSDAEDEEGIPPNVGFGSELLNGAAAAVAAFDSASALATAAASPASTAALASANPAGTTSPVVAVGAAGGGVGAATGGGGGTKLGSGSTSPVSLGGGGGGTCARFLLDPRSPPPPLSLSLSLLSSL